METHRALRPSPGWRIVCTGIVAILLVIFGGYFFLYPALTPDTIRGKVIGCLIVPQKDNNSRLWILTDGSFNYISSRRTPGHYSTGRKCFFCKAWMYEYDPFREKVTNKIKVDYDDIILNTSIFLSGKTIYHVADAYGSSGPKILTYDAGTGAMVSDTAGFAGRHPELAAGIAKVRYDRENNLLWLHTRDGKENLIYSPARKKLYPSYPHYLKEQNRDPGEAHLFVLCAEGSSNVRRVLYHVTGLRQPLLTRRPKLEGNCALHMERISRDVTGSTAQRLSETIFLQGIIYHQDDEGAIIIHVDRIGKKADRIMTCIDREGKTKWSVPQSTLFKAMKINEEKDAFSSMFHTKNTITVTRSGDLVVLMQKSAGIMGFQYSTGKRLFTMDL